MIFFLYIACGKLFVIRSSSNKSERLIVRRGETEREGDQFTILGKVYISIFYSDLELYKIANTTIKIYFQFPRVNVKT